MDCVGINANSPSNAILFLNALNAKRPLGRRKSEDNIVVKLLSLFTPELCPTISTMCMVELSAAEGDRRYWVNGANEGHRCWKLLRSHLEPIYRATFNRGGFYGARRGSAVNGALMAGDADGFDDETAEGA